MGIGGGRGNGSYTFFCWAGDKIKKPMEGKSCAALRLASAAAVGGGWRWECRAVLHGAGFIADVSRAQAVPPSLDRHRTVRLRLKRLPAPDQGGPAHVLCPLARAGVHSLRAKMHRKKGINVNRISKHGQKETRMKKLLLLLPSSSEKKSARRSRYLVVHRGHRHTASVNYTDVLASHPANPRRFSKDLTTSLSSEIIFS
jgi:hypothetical protein